MIDESRSDTIKSEVVASRAEQAIADLAQDTWAQLRSIVELVNTRWHVDGSNFRAPWDRDSDVPDPLVEEVAGFLHGHGLIVLGVDWTAWDQGRDLLNLYGIRNVAPKLGATEVLGMVGSVVGGDRKATYTLANSLENGSLSPLLERLLDFESKEGE
ncbi:DUF6508 domain-containing protein [Prescottella agglutinans]|uniref:DUF6508 domain-containing protein n=1 Tax=Prescottella agglutinans TaxID=1644129 RepID=UPI003D99D56F